MHFSPGADPLTEQIGQNTRMKAYYRFHSVIYDYTRWSFLFGRKALLSRLPVDPKKGFTFLEVGCGTGHNLKRVAQKFPEANLFGLDVSPDMIQQARDKRKLKNRKVSWFTEPYSPETSIFTNKLDVILFSYSLSMINPQWSALIQKAQEDLKDGGLIAVVDFHDTPLSWFEKHMASHHVKMKAHLLPDLKTGFTPLVEEVKPAYGGCWNYFLFIGKKENLSAIKV